jgi:hypothetical protein
MKIIVKPIVSCDEEVKMVSRKKPKNSRNIAVSPLFQPKLREEHQ